MAAGHEHPGRGPARRPGAVGLPGPRGRPAAHLQLSGGEHRAAEQAPGDEGRARGLSLCPQRGGTERSAALGESDAESENGAERRAGGRARAGGCTRRDGFANPLTPLLCVSMKASCDKMNVTNIFAGDKVREGGKKKNPECVLARRQSYGSPWRAVMRGSRLVPMARTLVLRQPSPRPAGAGSAAFERGTGGFELCREGREERLPRPWSGVSPSGRHPRADGAAGFEALSLCSPSPRGKPFGEQI